MSTSWAAVCIFVLASVWNGACTSRECAEQRAGQVRCVGNQLETCTADGSLVYESCASIGLVCSQFHEGCVTPEVAMTTSSTSTSNGSGGAGGATSSSSGAGAGGSGNGSGGANAGGSGGAGGAGMGGSAGAGGT